MFMVRSNRGRKMDRGGPSGKRGVVSLVHFMRRRRIVALPKPDFRLLLRFGWGLSWGGRKGTCRTRVLTRGTWPGAQTAKDAGGERWRPRIATGALRESRRGIDAPQRQKNATGGTVQTCA